MGKFAENLNFGNLVLPPGVPKLYMQRRDVHYIFLPTLAGLISGVWHLSLYSTTDQMYGVTDIIF